MSRELSHDSAEMPPTDESGTHESAAHESAMSALFGRSLIYVVVWALQLLVTSISSPLLAYLLGPGQFGMLATAIAIFQVLLVVAVFGLDAAMLIIYAGSADGRRQAREFIAFGSMFALALAGIMFASGPLWVHVLGDTPFSGTVAIAVLWVGPGAICMLLLAILRAEDRLRAFCVVSLISAVGGQVFGVVGLVTISRSATTYAWGGVIAQCAAMLLGLAAVRPIPRGILDLSAARTGLSLGFPLMLSGISGFLLNAGDRIVIRRFLGDVEVGRYQIAYIVGSTVILLLAFLNQVWLPRVLSVRDDEARRRLIEESRDLLTTVMIPIFLGLIVVAPAILAIVAPSSFRASGLLSVVLLVAASAFPVIDANASSRALIALKRPGAVAASTGVAAGLNILLNLALVPVLGINGSALATVVAFSVQALLARILVRRDMRVSYPSTRQVFAVVGAVAAAYVTTRVPTGGFWVLLRLVAALSLGFGAYLVLTRGGGPLGRHHKPSARRQLR